MLPDSSVVRGVLLDEGLLDALAPGTLLIDMSSSRADRDAQSSAEDRGGRAAS